MTYSQRLCKILCSILSFFLCCFFLLCFVCVELGNFLVSMKFIFNKQQMYSFTYCIFMTLLKCHIALTNQASLFQKKIISKQYWISFRVLCFVRLLLELKCFQCWMFYSFLLVNYTVKVSLLLYEKYYFRVQVDYL